jgi:hypothetical protein
MDVAPRSSSRFRLLDRPMVHLADALDGIRFSLWMPAGSRRTDASSSRPELTFAADADGDPLAVVVELARGRVVRTLTEHVAFWSALGDEIRRASCLVDGYLMTSIGHVDLNVVRQLRIGSVTLQCWAQIRCRSDTLDARIVWLESICSSLALG